MIHPFNISILPHPYIANIQTPRYEEIKSHTILQVIGANGTGKSTLLKKLSTQGKTPIYYQGHQLGLKENLTVFDHLKMRAQFFKTTKTISEALCQIHFSAFKDRTIHTLSAGEKKCLGWAFAWLSDVQIWILDEPFAHLDAEKTKMGTYLILEHQKNGGITLLSTHKKLDTLPSQNSILL